MTRLASIFSSLVRGERDAVQSDERGYEAHCDSCQLERWWQQVSNVAGRQVFECTGCGAQKVWPKR